MFAVRSVYAIILHIGSVFVDEQISSHKWVDGNL